MFFKTLRHTKKIILKKGNKGRRDVHTYTLLYKDIILIHLYMNKHQRNPHSKITSLRITGINIAS